MLSSRTPGLMCRAKVMVDLTGTSDEECKIHGHPQRALLGTFTKGAIRLTQSGADVFDPHKVSFEDILQANQLSKCLLTAYVVEEDWLREQLINVPRIILVSDDGKRSSQVRKYTLPGSRLTVVHPCFPRFPNYGVMHIKLMLLWYEQAGFLRVVVSSGNLRSEDYDRLQNVLFIQDLARLPTMDERRKRSESNDFLQDLLGLLPHLGITEDLVSEEADLRAYDWSALSVRLVYSLPGMHSVEVSGTGLAMLACKVGGPFTSHLLLECQGSSLGGLDTSWLTDVQCCAQGIIPSQPELQTGKQGSSALAKSPVQKRARLQKFSRGEPKTNSASAATNFCIIFPTIDYVMRSDPGAFGTIFCRSDMWQRVTYPRNLFHKCESLYGQGQPLHSKIITAFGTDGGEEDQSMQTVRWWYVGSHNFTPSAWGKFVKGKRSILIANYELGVVIPATAIIIGNLFPPSSPSDAKEGGESTFPYPYLRPPHRYTSDDGPWMQDLFYGN